MKTLHLKPLFVALSVAFPSILAQAASTLVPDAGSILQQIQPQMAPTLSGTDSGLVIKRADESSAPPGTPFLVKTINITGNKKIETGTLHALVAYAEGKTLTLGELDKVISRITDYYSSHGYPLARAIIPAQTLQAGVVNVQIIVARFGKIILDNRSPVNDPLLTSTLASLQPGQEITQDQLDRALLLLSDVPGVGVNAILKPGTAVGTSDLLVSAVPTLKVSGNVALDGYGNNYTGRARIGGTVNINDPLNLKSSDTLSVSGLSSGEGMNYGRIGYEAVINGQGTRLGGAYSALNYVLGGPVASSNANGTAQVTSLWVKHPFIRSRDVNLYAQIQYDELKLSDHIDISAIKTDRHLNNWTLSLAGDARDAIFSGGVNIWNVGWTTGQVSFDDAAALSADDATAKTQGNFSKLNVNLARTQNLGSKHGLYLSFSGQWASTNLDSSQKMTVGGPYSVRAYESGAVSGDTGYLLGAEYRRELGSAWNGQWQAVAFVDSAKVTVNKNTWSAAENGATLSGAGVGLNWAGPNQWSAKTYIAAPVGAVPTLVGTTNSVRAWVETRKGF